MVICNLYILIPRLGQNIWNWGIVGVGLSNEINQYSIQSSWFYGLWKIMMVAILAGQHLGLIALVTFNFLSNLNHLFPFYSSLHAIVKARPSLHLVNRVSCSIDCRKCQGIANFWISVWNNILCCFHSRLKTVAKGQVLPQSYIHNHPPSFDLGELQYISTGQRKVVFFKSQRIC